MLISDAVRRFLSAVRAGGRSRATLQNCKSALKELTAEMHKLGFKHIDQINLEALQAYREVLASRPQKFRGKPLSMRSQVERFTHVRTLCNWMVEQDWLVSDPTLRIPNPRKQKTLPKCLLEPDEVERIMSLPDMHTAEGFRDRVIMEVLYSSAIRRAEAAGLGVDDVNLERGEMLVHGKGGKDRMVPIGQRVCRMLESYITGIRADWLGADRDTALFLNRFGYRLEPQGIWHIVRKYADAAGLEKKVTPHTFRHSCATSMLRNGASIRPLQVLLGHESIESTQIYTHVVAKDVKDAHARFHPREQEPLDPL